MKITDETYHNGYRVVIDIDKDEPEDARRLLGILIELAKILMKPIYKEGE